jgi:hypothetical protein
MSFDIVDAIVAVTVPYQADVRGCRYDTFHLVPELQIGHDAFSAQQENDRSVYFRRGQRIHELPKNIYAEGRLKNQSFDSGPVR